MITGTIKRTLYPNSSTFSSSMSVKTNGIWDNMKKIFGTKFVGGLVVTLIITSVFGTSLAEESDNSRPAVGKTEDAAIENASFENEARLRVIVETDAGGDPDDEQSLVRFLLYCNEWDVEGIICARPTAREKENRNTARTGLGIVQRMVHAYGECYPNLVQHDARYPRPEVLLQHTVAGYEDRNDGVDLIIAAVDSDDPRPIWFMNWGTDYGSATSSLRRALDRILKERGSEGYAAFSLELLQ